MERNSGNLQTNGASQSQWGPAAMAVAYNVYAPVPGPSYLNAVPQRQLACQQPPAYQPSCNGCNCDLNLQRFHAPITSRPFTGFMPGVYPTISYSSPNRDSLTIKGISRPKKAKRIRTAFTTPQISILENEYVTNRYIDRARRIELESVLNVNERIILTWFQNRRMREKRDRLEESEDASSSTTTKVLPIPHERENVNQHEYVNGDGYVALQHVDRFVIQHQNQQVQYCATLPPLPPPPPHSGGLEGFDKQPELTKSTTTEAVGNDSSWDLDKWLKSLDLDLDKFVIKP